MGRRNIFFLIAAVMVPFLCLVLVWPLQAARAQAIEGGDAVTGSSRNRMEKARQRLEHMTSEQKEEHRAKMDRWKNLDPEQKEKIRKRFEQYQELPTEEKEVIKRNT